MEGILLKLIERPGDFSIEDFKYSLSLLFNNDNDNDNDMTTLTPLTPTLTTTSTTNNIQIGAFLALLSTIPLSVDLVYECASFLLQQQQQQLQLPKRRCEFKIIDIVGTGGDGKNTFNASTAASIVVAGCNLGSHFIIAKHGNRSSSSTSCGSADLIIQATGNPLDKHLNFQFLNTDFTNINQSSFYYLNAALYHPCLKYLRSIRKQLGIPTIFNLMGPLLNPLVPDIMIVGVAQSKYGPLMAQVLHRLGIKSFYIVHGQEGLDEISPVGDTTIWSIQNGNIVIEEKWNPNDFGLEPLPSLDQVKGGNAEFNCDILLKLLDNQLLPDDPYLKFVLLNAAALLYTAGKCSSLKQGVQMARLSVQSGSAKSAFSAFKSNLIHSTNTNNK